MATIAQIREAKAKSGLPGSLTKQDIQNAQKFGLEIFARTAAQINRNAPTPVQPIPTYDEFLKGAGSSYANLFSDETLNADFTPYYQYQQGAEDYQKGLAQQDLGQTLGRLETDYTQNVGDTQRQYGESFSNRGLFGSGIYQQELGRALSELQTGFGRQTGDLRQSFERSYGADEYTPYNQRKRQLEQERLMQIEQARNTRQGQAQDAYFSQYFPVLSQSYL